jgi:hypothetical protein
MNKLWDCFCYDEKNRFLLYRDIAVSETKSEAKSWALTEAENAGVCFGRCKNKPCRLTISELEAEGFDIIVVPKEES